MTNLRSNEGWRGAPNSVAVRFASRFARRRPVMRSVSGYCSHLSQ